MAEYENASNSDDATKAVDVLLSKELLRLSVQERNDLQEEIHGVKCMSPEETPAFIEEKLSQLSFMLNNRNDIIPPQEKQAYLKSQQFDEGRQYVNSMDFRLRFLRCDFFDVKKAAKLLTKHLDCVVELFGLYALTRPIQLEDFNKKELQIIRKGYVSLNVCVLP